MKARQRKLLQQATGFEKLSKIYDDLDESVHNSMMNEVCKGLQRVCEILAEAEETENES